MRALVFRAALVAATALVATPSFARDRDRDYRDRDRETFIITPNQVVDMADARIAQLKADLRLTPDQDRNWGGLQTALHDMAQRRADRMAKMREQRSAADANANAPAATAGTAPAPADPNARPVDPSARPIDARDARRADRDSRDRPTPDIVAEMRRQADALADRADDYRKFADASGPLYGSLEDSQKRRFLAFVQRNLMDEPDGPAYRR